MRGRAYTSEGVVLVRKNYGEADRILTVFSKDFGKLPLMAKSVRRPASRKRGGIEVFSHIKFQAVSGKGMDLITEVEVINSFNEIRADLNKVSVSYYFCEVVGKITNEKETNREVFLILLKYLNRLISENKLKTLRNEFAREVLVTLGFWPQGQALPRPDDKLQEVIEKELSTIRIGKKLTI